MTQAGTIPGFSGTVLANEPMARHTSFRIGGPADLLAVPRSESDVVSAVRWAIEKSLPLTVLGNGTNVLVADRGIRGLVLLMDRNLAEIRIEGHVVYAEAGAPLLKVAMQSARAGLSGLEFAEGIPGSLGGGIFMNAGTSLGEVKDSLIDVRAVTWSGDAATVPVDDLGLAYRSSRIAELGLIVVSARFGLRPSSKEEINAAMERLRSHRVSNQPHWARSAGCVFKNTERGSTGRLLDESGAKGMRRGGAVVSALHANFIVNECGATAEDVAGLMREMAELVLRKTGVALTPEVRFIGDWDAPVWDNR